MTDELWVVDKVEEYFITHPEKLFPLSFAEYTSYAKVQVKNVEFELDEKSDIPELAQKILWVLDTAVQYGSIVNRKGATPTYLYCHYGAYRSSVDIWRHLLPTNPELKLTDVMQMMYQIYKNNWRNKDGFKLYSHFCTTIMQRVFSVLNGSWATVGDRDCVDEFGTVFIEWSDLKYHPGADRDNSPWEEEEEEEYYDDEEEDW